MRIFHRGEKFLQQKRMNGVVYDGHAEPFKRYREQLHSWSVCGAGGGGGKERPNSR
jgi:hypothetical protein